MLQTNTECGEENVQVKVLAYVHRWVGQIYLKDFGVVRNMFKQNMKIKKVTN